MAAAAWLAERGVSPGEPIGLGARVVRARFAL
jgi:hypothetical protein